MAWLSDYSYRKEINLTGQSGAGTNYQVKLLIGESSGATGEDFDIENHDEDWIDDIRFTDNDETTELDFWVESTSGSAPNRLATVWVEVADDLGSNQSIYIYYGKSGDSSASDGVNTFNFFDDFNRDDSATVGNGWTESGNAQIKDNALYANDVLSNVERSFSFSSGMFAIRTRSKSMAHKRSYYTDIRDGSHRSILALSLYSSAPKDDAIISYNPDTTLLDPYTEGEYYILENCRIDTNNFNHYVNDGEYSNEGHDPNTTTSDNEIGLRLAGDSGSSSYTDWILVRKYASTEPSFSSAEAEESSGAPPAGIASKRLLIGQGI